MVFNKTEKNIIILLSALILIFGFSCAKQVAPTGGPVDREPPKLLECIPEKGSVNFSENRIRIFFDEYIRLNNLNQKLIISPPIEPAPDIRIRGKGIQIDLDPENLEENTTYNFNFNDAIADNNENNVLHSFIYAFSTGPYIDSLTVGGVVYDAYTRKPVDDAYVLLHNNLNDTAFKTIRPVYLTKVDKNGKFKIPYIKEGTYNIFAIVDANYNYKFDQAEEQIAFIDSVIYPEVIKFEEIRIVDSIDIENNDTIKKELIIPKQRFVPDSLTLLLFIEDFENQYIKDRKRKIRENIEIIFNRTQYNDFNFLVKDDENAIIICRENPDTVSIWLTNEELIKKDTVFVWANYYSHHNPDSLISDTLRLTARDLKKTADTVLMFTAPTRKHPAKDYKLNFTFPVKCFDESKIILEKLVDTVYEKQDLKIFTDSLNPLCLSIISDFEEGKNYRLAIDDDFAESFYGLYNLADTIEFSITPEANFGSLVINIDNDEKNYIVQLLRNDKKEYETIADKGIAEINYISPGAYKIKLIIDKNNNQRWDTGNFDKKIQPEPVLFYPGEIEIRANWKNEIDWTLNDNDNNKKQD